MVVIDNEKTEVVSGRLTPMHAYNLADYLNDEDEDKDGDED